MKLCPPATLFMVCSIVVGMIYALTGESNIWGAIMTIPAALLGAFALSELCEARLRKYAWLAVSTYFVSGLVVLLAVFIFVISGEDKKQVKKVADKVKEVKEKFSM